MFVVLFNGSISSQPKTAAYKVHKELGQPVDHTCGGEYAANDAAELHKELPQWHVVFCDCHHQGTDVILHEYTRNAVATCSMIDHTLPFCHRELVGVSVNFAGVQFGWDDGDEILVHLITFFCNFFRTIQGVYNSRHEFAKGHVVNTMREVVAVMAHKSCQVGMAPRMWDCFAHSDVEISSHFINFQVPMDPAGAQRLCRWVFPGRKGGDRALHSTFKEKILQ